MVWRASNSTTRSLTWPDNDRREAATVVSRASNSTKRSLTWSDNDSREAATVVSRASNSTKRSLTGNSSARFPMIGVIVPNVTKKKE